MICKLSSFSFPKPIFSLNKVGKGLLQAFLIHAHTYIITFSKTATSKKQDNMCVCVCVCVYTYTHTHIYKPLKLYKCIYVCVSVYIRIYLSLSLLTKSQSQHSSCKSPLYILPISPPYAGGSK